MSLTVAKVREQLSDIVTSSQFLGFDDQLKLYVRFRGVLDDILELLDNPVGPDVIEMLKVFIETIVDENVSLVISRQILTDFNSKVLIEMNNTPCKSLAFFMLDKMCQRSVSFEEQISNTRLHLSTIYEKEKNFKDAVIMLIANPFESGQKLRSVNYKFATLIRIARLYLEDNSPLQAELYINRASILQSEDESLQMAYKLTHASVLEYRHKFIEAAHKFNELSLSSKLTENERMASLTRAIVCSILSPAGDRRFKMLTTLYNDERCQTLINFSILKKLYLCRMIKPDEVDQIETMLLPYQKAKTKNNTYLLAEAMFEHNTLSISKLYKNIKIESLASLLKVDPYKAEIIAARMISEERMKGSIDQIEGFIHFQCKSLSSID
ncbi:hypothetical protein QTP88_001983 [Uroleucon formosanum]